MPEQPFPRPLLVFARAWSEPMWRAARKSAAWPAIEVDIARWVECLNRTDLEPLSARDQFAYFVGVLREFRALIHIRIDDLGWPTRLLLRHIYPGTEGLAVRSPSIGPGLFLHHGNGTIVAAHSIGKNFWVNQHASVGHNRHGIPTIGDDVTIGAGAVVVGPITIGDGAVIGANAVVFEDVPAGAVMLAPPAVMRERSR